MDGYASNYLLIWIIYEIVGIVLFVGLAVLILDIKMKKMPLITQATETPWVRRPLKGFSAVGILFCFGCSFLGPSFYPVGLNMMLPEVPLVITRVILGGFYLVGVFAGILNLIGKYRFWITLVPAVSITLIFFEPALFSIYVGSFLLHQHMIFTGIGAITFWLFIFLKRLRPQGAEMSIALPITVLSLGGMAMIGSIIAIISGNNAKQDVYDAPEWTIMRQLPPDGEQILHDASIMRTTGIVVCIVSVILITVGVVLLFRLKAMKRTKNVPLKIQGQHVEGSPASLPTTQPAPVIGKAQQKLQELENLRKSGLITEEEYASKRQNVINTL